MTTHKEALTLALEALEAHADIGIKSDKAITSLRQAIAEAEKQPKREPLTDDMVVAAARALNKAHCQACNVDEEDSWKVYGNDYLHDARIALTAAHGIKE
jgi:hypothetical protein